MTEVSLRAVGVSKWYGKVTAVQDVSLHLEPGIWGLLGPNGSGKSTLLNMFAGQLRPAVGQILVGGESPFANPSVLRRIGHCPEADALYDELTALEFVSHMAMLSGFAPKDAKKRAEAMLETFGLKDAMNRPAGGYSRGMRQRVKLAQTLVHEPDVILLDEPLTGTDPASRHLILSEVQKRADAGAVVLFSTHVLPEVEAVTDRLLLIARGLVVAQGRASEIRELLDEHPHRIRIELDESRQLAAALVHLPGVRGLEFGEGWVEVMTAEPDATYRGVADVVTQFSLPVRSMTSPDANLEALFHYLVQRASQGAGTGADAGVGRAAGVHRGAAQQSGDAS